MRSLTFRSIVHQEMAFFDQEENTTAQLQNKLATDGDAIQGATGTRVANVIKNFMTLLVSLAIGFFFNWIIALVAIAFIPLIGLCQVVINRELSGAGAEAERVAFESAQIIVSESTKNIRTVTSLQCQDQLKSEFSKNLEKPAQQQKRKAFVVGFAMGFADSSLFLAYASCFWLGAWLIDQEIEDANEFDSIFKAMMGVVFGAMVLGQNTAFMANYAEAISAGRRLLSIIESKPSIDVANGGGGIEKLDNCEVKMQVRIVLFKLIHKNIFLQSINFAYPTRPKNQILKNFDLQLKSGETVALVGESGQGKSTMVQLILRFYDAVGDILIDGVRLKSLNISYLR